MAFCLQDRSSKCISFALEQQSLFSRTGLTQMRQAGPRRRYKVTMRALVFIRSIGARVTAENLTERRLPADNIVKGNIWYGMVHDLSRYRALVR